MAGVRRSLFGCLLRPTQSRGISLQRRVCYLIGDPFTGKEEQALLGIYNFEQEAEAALKSSPAVTQGLTDRVPYAFYRGPENVILPTIVTATTAPRLVAVLQALTAQESKDAQQAGRTLVEVFLALIPFRGGGNPVTSVIKRLRGRGTPPVPEPAPVPAQAAVPIPKGEVAPAQMLKLLQEIWRRAPLLQRLNSARSLPRAAKHKELLEILKKFQEETGVIVEKVRTGVVQAARGRKNYASLRSKPGFLQIEEHVYQDTELLMNEVSHELPYHYTEGGGPLLGRLRAHELLEMMVESGEAAVVKALSGTPIQ